jgi:starvation-inducible DNA-binding protein
MNHQLMIEKNASPLIPSGSVQTCKLLSQCLINCIDLRLQCKQAQWDMIGAGVDTYAALFGQSAAALEAYADRLAARIHKLGGTADGRIEEVLERSGLNIYPPAPAHDFRHVEEVASSFAVAAFSLHSDYVALAESCDPQSNALLADLTAYLEKRSCIIQSQ